MMISWFYDHTAARVQQELARETAQESLWRNTALYPGYPYTSSPAEEFAYHVRAAARAGKLTIESIVSFCGRRNLVDVALDSSVRQLRVQLFNYASAGNKVSQRSVLFGHMETLLHIMVFV